jgi:hypothetical protein
MNKTKARWIVFIIVDSKTGKALRNSGFSGNTYQRRKQLRAMLQHLRKGRAITVTKSTWEKGSSYTTLGVEWRKELPAI